MSARRRLAYLVSRFPAASETFVVRELNEVERDGGFELSLMSLFPSEDGFLHPEAERWAPGLLRPSAAEGLAATLWWLGRRPLRTLGIFARVVAGTLRSPRIMLRSLATLPVAAAHARTVRERGIEHLHAHFAAYPALAAWVCGRLCDVPYSFTAHAYDIFVDQSLLATKVAEAEFVVTISEFNRRFLAGYGGGEASPVHVVHCGVDPELYRFRPRRIDTERELRALCVASLQEKKGHAFLLDALAAAGPGLDRLSLDLVGGGELMDELRDRAARLGLADRVRFHGARSQGEVRELLDASDIFVLPSIIASDGQMEGLPVALIESLACGLPTVATRISGIPELIDDGRTGVLAEPADVASLAAALERVVEGPALDLEAARLEVEAEFDVRESGRRMAALFGGSPPRRPA